MGDFERFYNKALEFLSYRPRSEKEVREKLKTKKVEPSTIDRIIAKLIDKKFIDDEEFAKGWIDSRLRFKPRSARLIKLELKQKGISPETVDNLELTIEDDLESARKLVEKRLGRVKNLPKQKIYEKTGRYLASKGFNWDIIKKSIDEALSKGV
ncbi:MAG: RecX family transcriptional regulator [Candidatus Levybacteria bacterium]|nr:RecX family transcriptional regulator [Candidatus Levybacteria bacterium]